MSYLTNFFAQNGLPPEFISALFLLPLAMTVIVAARQIIGIRGFGISAPLLLGIAFSATGIQAGLILFFSALAGGVIFRSILTRMRLLYLPKMAVILFGAMLALFLALPFIPYGSGLIFPQVFFSLLIIILSVEQFASLLMDRGIRKTFALVLETAALSASTFFLITSLWLQRVALDYPLALLIAALIINLGLGRWTGLRVSEYIRFKNIIFK